MSIDFWNNPIVVSAFRVKYRRGGVFNITTLYLILLVAGGAVMAHYDDPPRFGPWPRNYLLALLALQFVISPLIAGNATAESLRSEITNRTLDFQRIATLSPSQILVGKLLGEPALAYLLAIATIPLAVYCWTLGVMGVSLEVLVLAYTTLASTMLLFGSVGLLQRIEARSSRARAGVGAVFGAVVVMGLIGLPPLLANARPLLAVPRSAAAIGLLTPIPLFFGISTGDPWKAHLLFFGVPIPLLLVTPLGQLALASLCFHVMRRRLLNPLNPSLSKRFAYLALLAADVLTAAILLEPQPFGLALGPRVTAFCVVHLLAGLWLMNCVTPWRESLESWVWRLRGRSSRLWDWWLGERSENGLVLITFCALGILCLVQLVLIPAGLQEGAAEIRDSAPIIISVAIATTLLMLAFGTLHQWFVFIAGRTGKVALLTFLVIIILPLHVLGEYYQSEFLLGLCPTAHLGRWFSGRLLPHQEYMLVVYGALLIWSWLSLRRRLGRLEKTVDQKLQMMGVGSKQ